MRRLANDFAGAASASFGVCKPKTGLADERASTMHEGLKHGLSQSRVTERSFKGDSKTRTFPMWLSTYVENACRTANGTAQPAWSFRTFRKPLGPWSSSRRRASRFLAGTSARCLSITVAASSAARAARVGLRAVWRGPELDKASSIRARMAWGRVRPRPSPVIQESSDAKSSGCIRTPISVPLPVGGGPLRFFVITI